MQPNIEEVKRSLTEKPLFATSAERFLILDQIKSSYCELPQPLRFSHTLATLLSKVSTPLVSHDLIAGRCVDRELSEAEEAQFQAFIKHPDHPSKLTFLSSGHGTYSWDAVVDYGLPGLKQQALEAMQRVDSEEKKQFLVAMVEIYDAISEYSLRYAKAAKERGMHELADNLQKAATQKPDSFAVALQLLWMITLINCAYISENPTLTVGRLDRILYPLYQADLQSGRLSRERAKEYITDYYCKHNLIMGRGEHQVGDETNSTTFKRITNFDAPQYLLLAGTDEEGNLVANELTELFAECIVPEFKNPVIVVRYVKDMDRSAPTLWRTLCDRALSSASMMFYNDSNVLSAFERIGLPKEDAQKYAHFGCNWCSPGDNAAWMLSSPKSRHYNTYRSEEERQKLSIVYMRTNTAHGWPEDFLNIMRELSYADRPVTIEDFYTRFLDTMGDFIDRKLEHNSLELAVRKRKPSSVMSFSDCFLRDSVRKGECFSASAKYHFQLQSFQMFGTVVDCFIAVDQLVMIEKKLTLKELLCAVDANFEGYPHVLALCRNADKYGMDTPLSNYHVKRLSHAVSDMVIRKNKPYLEREGLFLVPCMQSDTWHLKLGETFGATPNGRLAYTPFSQNTRPSNGACVNGMSAMFNDMLLLPHDGLVSGALNLDVDPRPFEGDEGHGLFASILATYFNRGGLHAQVSCAKLSDLLEAKKDPQSHRDLRVRVTGYSGIFVDICERLQNDIIERFQ